MGALGSGTSTSYPVTLDTLLYVSGGGKSDYTNGPNPIADSQSRVDAEFMNDVIDAIIAIQTELGTSPSGVYSTVAERFDTIGGAGGGFPGASTDNAIVRWNGSTGTSLQDSGIIITDTNNVDGIVDLTIARNLLVGGAAAGTLLNHGIVIALGIGPSTNPVNAIQMWAADRAGTPGKTSLHVRAEDGTQHVLGDRVGIGTVAPAEALEVVGGIKLGTTALLANGTIRFTGADIEGRINDAWVSMTAGSAGGTTSGIWKWSTSTVTPPAAQSIAVNNTDYSSATEMYITEVSSGGTDSSILLDDLDVGDTIYIQDRVDSSKSIRYTVSGTLTDVGTYRTIPVTFVSTGAANISNNAEIYVQFNLAGIHGSGSTNSITIWSDQYTLSADAQLHYDSTSNNLGLKTTTFGTGAQAVLGLGLGVAPSTSPLNMVQLWAAYRGGVGGKTGLFIRSESGATHVFSDYVGLNNLTPLSELDVVGSQRITKNATSSSNLWNVLNLRVKATTDVLSPNFGTLLSFNNENFTGTSFEVARISGARGSADTSGILSFSVANAGVFGKTVSIDKDANFIINVASVGTNLVQGVVIGSGTAPTTSPADAIQMWSADRAATAGKASLHLRTEDGTSHVFGDRVGIGTVTPGFALDVVGAINVSDPTTTRTNIGLGTTNDVQFTRLGLGIAPTASAPLLFAAGVAQKILLSGDAVGSRYGLAVAAAALQVFGAGAASVELGSMSTVDGITFTSRLSVYGTSGNVGVGTGTFGTGATRTFALFNGVAPTTSPADTVQLWSADRNATAGKGSLHLRTEDGTSHVFGDMVGIGTTNPTAALDVIGALKVSDVATTQANLGIGSASSSQLDRLGLGTPATADARLTFLAEVGQKLLLYGNGITTRNGLGVASGVMQVFSQSTGTVDIGSMSTADGTTFTNRLSINGTSGNVGLGTKTYGTSAARVFALFAGTAPTTSPADTVQMWTADTNAVAGKAGLHIRTEDGTSHVFGDKVGIGTTAPTVAFEVAGAIKALNVQFDRIGLGQSSSTNARLVFSAELGQKILLYGDGVAARYGLGLASGVLQVFSATTGNIQLGTMDTTDGVTFTPIMTILPTAVGIGVVDPLRAMHVVGSNSARSGFRTEMYNTSTVATDLQMIKARGTVVAPEGVIDNDGIGRWISYGYARNSTDTAMANISVGLIDMSVDSIDAQGRIGGRLVFYTNPGVSGTITEKMRLTQEGWLGIGMTDPKARLHLTNENLTTGQLILGSQRIALVVDNVIGGADFWSNDTNLTSPGQMTAYVRALADETHTATTLGTRMTFATTAVGATTPTLRMTLKSDGSLNMVSGNKITLNESGNSKYGMVFGGGNTLQIFGSDSASTTGVSIGGMSSADGVTFSPVLRVKALSKNIILGTANDAGTSASFTFGINIGTAPTTSPVDMVQLWAADRDATAGTASLHVRTESGVIHVLGDYIGFGMADPYETLNVLGIANYFERHDAVATGYFHVTRKSRGTRAVPLRVAELDYVSYYGSQAYVRNAANTADQWNYMSRIDTRIESVDAEGRAGGVLIFYTSPPVSGSLTERMRITQDGFVGIGVSVPTTVLHVGNNNVTDAGLILTSQRVAIATDNLLNGIDFHSNDTNLSPTVMTAYIRAYASETHTATTLGTRIAFATTSIGAAAPTWRMTLLDTGVLSFGTWTGQKINLYDTILAKYGFGIGSSQMQIYSPNSSSARVEIGGMSSVDGVTFVPVLRVIPVSTSMVLGPVAATAVGTSGAFVFGISTGTRPTTSPAAMAQLWVEDYDTAGTGSLHIRSESNWITKIGNGIITRAAYLNMTTQTIAAPHVAVALEESNRTYLAANTTAMAQVSLPAAAAGYTFKFVVTVAQGLRIRAFTSDTIRIGSTVTAAAGYVQSTTVGDYLELIAVSSSAWIARSPIQGWTVGV